MLGYIMKFHTINIKDIEGVDYMWTYKFSNGYTSNIETESHEDILFDIALMIRFQKWFEPTDPIYPDVYIYKNDILDEVIYGKEIANEREIREYNKSRKECGLSTI